MALNPRDWSIASNLGDLRLNETRRQFFASGGLSLGTAALASLLSGRASADVAGPSTGVKTGIGAGLPMTHFAPKAKNVIYLHMLGGPSQMDLYGNNSVIHMPDLPCCLNLYIDGAMGKRF